MPLRRRTPGLRSDVARAFVCPRHNWFCSKDSWAATAASASVESWGYVYPWLRPLSSRRPSPPLSWRRRHRAWTTSASRWIAAATSRMVTARRRRRIRHQTLHPWSKRRPRPPHRSLSPRYLRRRSRSRRPGPFLRYGFRPERRRARRIRSRGFRCWSAVCWSRSSRRSALSSARFGSACGGDSGASSSHPSASFTSSSTGELRSARF